MVEQEQVHDSRHKILDGNEIGYFIPSLEKTQLHSFLFKSTTNAQIQYKQEPVCYCFVNDNIGTSNQSHTQKKYT
jgi:hypothetical protein